MTREHFEERASLLVGTVPCLATPTGTSWGAFTLRGELLGLVAKASRFDLPDEMDRSSVAARALEESSLAAMIEDMSTAEFDEFMEGVSMSDLGCGGPVNEMTLFRVEERAKRAQEENAARLGRC